MEIKIEGKMNRRWRGNDDKQQRQYICYTNSTAKYVQNEHGKVKSKQEIMSSQLKRFETMPSGSASKYSSLSVFCMRDMALG